MGVRRLAVVNGPNIFQMLLVWQCDIFGTTPDPLREGFFARGRLALVRRDRQTVQRAGNIQQIFHLNHSVLVFAFQSYRHEILAERSVSNMTQSVATSLDEQLLFW